MWKIMRCKVEQFWFKLGPNCPFAWNNYFSGKLTYPTIVYLFYPITLQYFKKVIRVGQIMRDKVLQFWTKSDTNHPFTNKGDFIEKFKHQAWNNEASIVKYVRHTWKPCVKSTMKALEQWEWYCSGVFIFDFWGIFATQLQPSCTSTMELWRWLTAKS